MKPSGRDHQLGLASPLNYAAIQSGKIKSPSKKEAGLDVSHHALVPARGGERIFFLTSSFIGCVKSRSANSRRRSPQPSNTARIARSLFPLSVFGAGDCEKRRASSAVSQFPSLTPSFLAPFTRRIPAASSGLSKPASAAS